MKAANPTPVRGVNVSIPDDENKNVAPLISLQNKFLNLEHGKQEGELITLSLDITEETKQKVLRSYNTELYGGFPLRFGLNAAGGWMPLNGGLPAFHYSLRHRSLFQGPVDEVNSAWHHSQVHLAGRLSLGSPILQVGLKYEGLQTAFYGYTEEEKARFSRQKDKKHMHSPLLYAILSRSDDAPENDVPDYKIELHTGLYTDNLGVQEFEAQLLGSGFYPLSDDVLGLRGELKTDFLHHSAQGSRPVTQGYLAVQWKAKKWLAKGGFSGGYAFTKEALSGEAASYVLAPFLDVSYSLQPALRLFLRADGGIQPLRLRELMRRVPWLDAENLLRHSRFWQGELGASWRKKAISVHARGQWQLQQGRAFWASRPEEQQFYHLVYEEGNTHQLTGQVEIEYRSEDGETYANLSAAFHHYTLDSLAEAWHSPAVELSGVARIAITENLSAQPTIQAQFGLLAPPQADEESAFALAPLLLFDFRVNYALSKQAELFALGENLLFNAGEQLRFYPTAMPAASVGVRLMIY